MRASVVAPLPRSLSSFVGRTRELSEIGLLLAQFPLVTLTGIGGSGKTRLALEAAREFERRGDGVAAFAELASTGDTAGVVPAVARALGVPEEPGRPLLETLMEALAGRPLLLVLDNCEHLLDPVARLLARVLPAAPLVRVLATSREPLGLGGERTFFVRSLALPPEGSAAAFADLAGCDAVRLFVERATTVAPGFTLTEGSADLIGQLVRRLDGIPLAIELAAARVRSLPLSQIVKRLDDRFRLLAGGSRAAIERHQTLRAAIDWSWEHLSGPERVLLRRTGSFAGGFTLEAAEAVAVDAGLEAGLGRAEVADVLGRLVDKSLVLFEPEHSRYSLLETMRQYARERLVASREAERVGAAHQKMFLALACEAKTRLRGPERVAWLDRLEREHANLLAALDWRGATGPASTDAVERALQLVDALTGFWEPRGHVTRVRPRVDALLAEEKARAGTAARVWALNGAGILAYRESDAPGARRRYEEMLSIARSLGDRRAIAVALHNLSNVIAQEGDQARARALLEESVATHREMGSHWDVANGLINLGLRARDAGEPAAAEPFLRDALTIARTLGDKQQIAIAFAGLAWVAIDRQDAAAAPLAEEALALFREIGHREFAAECTACLGLCALAAGDVAGARARIVEALSALEEIGHPFEISSVLGWAALVDAAAGRPARAAQLLGAAETLRQQIGATPTSPDEALLRRGLASLRAILGDETFERERQAGRAYTMGQAIDRALGRER